MNPAKLIPKRIVRAIMEYGLIKENDRILLALSGGKDSLALTYFLSRLSISFPVSFQVEAIHISSPWEEYNHSEQLASLCSKWNIPYTNQNLDIKNTRKDCFSCSRNRRKTLLKFASENGYNSLALGHHMEDCLETFLMNLVYNSRIDPLLPLRIYPDNNQIKLIRPLILLQEKIISRWAEENKIPVLKCQCPWKKENSRRIEMRTHLETLTGKSIEKKLNIFSAVIGSGNQQS